MSESGPRVLVIDDERSIRRFLRASLSAHGYEIFEAATGQEGIQSVAVHRPDLIILDLGLPDIEGLDVTRQLREWTQIPIIILSGESDERRSAAGEALGAVACIEKNAEFPRRVVEVVGEIAPGA